MFVQWVSHIRVFMERVGAPLAPFFHPRVKLTLDAIKRDKTYTPSPKLPVPMSALRRILQQFTPDPEGRVLRAVVLLL